jgi:hypothetical protein
MFLILSLLAQHIFGIVGSQIETKWVISLTCSFMDLCQSRLQIDNLKRFVFVNKNQPNDPQFDWNTPKKHGRGDWTWSKFDLGCLEISPLCLL